MIEFIQELRKNLKESEKEFMRIYGWRIEKERKRLISEFLSKIRHIPLFWVINDDYLKEVYKAIDEIRDYYQKEIKNL